MSLRSKQRGSDMNADEFWSKVDKSGDCWIWNGYVNVHGYGSVSFGGIKQNAHRVAWRLTHGPIKPGPRSHDVVVAHSCDNRRCVNPAHLFLATQKENIHDSMRKGRRSSVLSEADVHAILDAARKGEDRKSLAVRFNVHPQTISDIASRKLWAHIRREPVELAVTQRAYNTKPNSGSFKKGSKGNPGPKPEKRTIDYSEAKRLHAQGHSIREVARRMNTTHTTVRRALGG